MLPGQQYAEPRADDAVTEAARPLPQWRTTIRTRTLMVCERILGECFVPNARTGLLVLAVVVGLLAVIAVTLSVGNALLVLLVATVMRLICERRG
jgi:hypothetical protein